MLNLAEQYEQLQTELDEAIHQVLKSGVYINGPKVRAFEESMEKFLGVKHAIGVASGSDALLLSLDALGIGKGDKVIVPALGFYAAAAAVVKLGGIPVLVDVDSHTGNLDLNKAEVALQQDNSIKAIIPIHMYGQACAMDKVMDLAQKYGLKVIEDAGDAINAEVQMGDKTVKAGTIGDTGCFSFHPHKLLGAYGDGGMIVTNDDLLDKKLRILRDHGANPPYIHLLLGYNSRLDALQAALLDVKIKYLQAWTEQQKKAAKKYMDLIDQAEIKEIRYLDFNEGHCFSNFVIQANFRNDLVGYLKFSGIETEVKYPVPLHLQDCFYDLGYEEGAFPAAENLSMSVLALPINPYITDEQIGYVVDKINEFYTERRRLLSISCDLYS